MNQEIPVSNSSFTKLKSFASTLFKTLKNQIVLVMIVSASPLLAETPLPRLHVCTVANYMHPNLEKLMTSCEQNDIELEILGMGKPYSGNIDKLRIIKNYCDQLTENDLILFVDAFDVLILANPQEIISRFLSLNVPMLMATEMNCWPSKDTAKFHPHTPSPFKYINSGGYIGWAQAIKSWLNAFDNPLLSGKSDQEAVHKLFAQKPHFYALDHSCAIFLCLFQVPYNAVLINPVNKTITCTYTNSSPCVLHANGGSFPIWNQVYSAFFAAPQTNTYR
jgi:hypothetical protein